MCVVCVKKCVAELPRDCAKLRRGRVSNSSLRPSATPLRFSAILFCGFATLRNTQHPMKFGSVTLENAVGKILGHNVIGQDGRRLLRKGRLLGEQDVAKLRDIGRTHIHVAELAPTDVDENAAAHLIANAILGDNFRLSRVATGRVNMFAEALGLLRIDAEALFALNRLDGITLATLPANAVVRPGKMVATIKIIPYAVSAETIATATTHNNILTLTVLKQRSVGLILSGSPNAKERIVRSFDNALRPRIEALNSQLTHIDFVPLEDEQGEADLATAIQHLVKLVDLIVLAGDTAIMDRHDIAPMAVERAGGEIEIFGAPVDPGNLLLLGYVGDRPIVGAPGCARSPKDNIVDIVLPRLLAGDRLTEEDIISFALGGLLEDVPERPLPRSKLQ